MVRRVSEAFLVVALTANKRSTSGAKGTSEKMQIHLNNVFYKRHRHHSSQLSSTNFGKLHQSF